MYRSPNEVTPPLPEGLFRNYSLLFYTCLQNLRSALEEEIYEVLEKDAHVLEREGQMLTEAEEQTLEELTVEEVTAPSRYLVSCFQHHFKQLFFQILNYDDISILCISVIGLTHLFPYPGPSPTGRSPKARVV